jgi:hypothetical protein
MWEQQRWGKCGDRAGRFDELRVTRPNGRALMSIKGVDLIDFLVCPL